MKTVTKNISTYLLTGVPTAGDDGDSADLEELHFGFVEENIVSTWRRGEIWRWYLDCRLQGGKKGQ